MLNVLANWPAQPEEREIIAASWPEGATVHYGQDLAPEELDRLLPEIDVIIGAANAPMLRRAERLKFIHVLGHGVDRLGEPETAAILRERGIPIARANPAAITISEFVVMSMVALTRSLIQIHEALAYRGDWSRSRLPGRMQGSLGGELHGATLTIAGLGSIGQEIAKRAKAFGMRVGALTRAPEKYDAAALGLDFLGRLDAPEAHLARTDHLVLALPANPDTRLFLSAERIAALKERSYLVNIGRASLVDQEAMVQALAMGRLAGAAIDVWPNEELRTYPSPQPIHHFNVIMTPHSCAMTRESRVRALQVAGANLERALRGEALVNAASVDG